MISHMMNLIKVLFYFGCSITSEVSRSNFRIRGRAIIEGVCLKDSGMSNIIILRWSKFS